MSDCISTLYVSFGGKKEHEKLNEAIQLLWVMQNTNVISWTNCWVFASSSRWYVFLPLISFCSSCCAFYCLIPLIHRALRATVTDLDFYPLNILVLFFCKTAKSDSFRPSQLHKNFPLLINSSWRRGCHLGLSLCFVLTFNPKKSQNFMQQHPHIIITSFILMTTLWNWLLGCWWNTDRGFKNVYQQMMKINKYLKQAKEIKMQITCCRNSSRCQEKF